MPSPPADASRPEVFEATSGRVTGVFGLVLVAIGVVLTGVDAVDQGFAYGHVVAVCSLALVGVVVWSTQLRPGVSAYHDHLMLRSIWRTTRIPWPRVSDARVRQTLVVRSDDGGRHVGIAVGRSARQLIRAEHATPTMGSGSDGAAAAKRQDSAYARYVEQRIVDRSRAAAREPGHDPDAPVRHEWSWPLIATEAALALVLVVLLVVR